MVYVTFVNWIKHCLTWGFSNVMVLESFLKCKYLGSNPRYSDLIFLVVGSGICVLNKLLSDADAASLWNLL